MSIAAMEMLHITAQYHAMNPGHLTIDELEHELKIRGSTTDASRSASERTLRCRLKEEKDKSDVAFQFVSESVVEELEVCDGKLNGIKNHLEKRRSKRAPDQLFKTRLIHILFRMHRLRANTKKEDEINSLAVIAGECVKLLSVYFSANSHLPEVREAELAIINESLHQLRNEEVNENADHELEEIVNENLVERSTEDSVSGLRGKESNEVSAVGGSESEKVDSEKDRLADEIRQLASVVSLLLQRITVLESKQPVSQSQSQDVPLQTNNSTRIEERVTQEKRVEKTQPKPVDFLDWIKQKNDSLETLKSAEEKKTVANKENEISDRDREKSRSMNSSSRFPIHKWAIRYDGMDNGRRLNEFLKEVEFNARSEGFSGAELFQGAHHLFTQKARSWFMEVSTELNTWDELVEELKKEFLPVDIDYVYERQANNRKQGSREKFQDFYLDMVRIFRCMSIPWDEKRKFDVLFRNTRDDCRIAMLAANVDSIPKMKDFGKRFDSINWHMYQKKDVRFSRKEVVQIDEVRQQQSFQDHRDRYQNRNQNRGDSNRQFEPGENQLYQKRNWKQQQEKENQNNQKYTNFIKPKTKPDNTQQLRRTDPGPSGTSALQRIVSAYIPVRKNVCYNCHEGGHDFRDCTRERKMFCERCGFPGFLTKDCPYCQSKNGPKTA